MKTYLALDPGAITGVALLRPDKFVGLEIQGRHELERYVTSVVESVPDLQVIVERWDVRGDTHRLSNQDDPRYIIGYVEGLCSLRAIDYHEQAPSQRTWVTNSMLRKLGWYTGREGHADDAARHLLTHLSKLKGQPFNHLLAEVV